MKTVIGELISGVEKNQEKTGQSERKRKDVQQRKDLILLKASHQNFERQDKQRDIEE